MATATLLSNGEQQFCDGNGAPYAGGSVYFYIPNTTTFKNTWKDPNQSVLNTNPVILDSAGRAIIYGSGQYTQVLYDQFNNLIWNQLTQDVSYSAAQAGFAPLASPAFTAGATFAGNVSITESASGSNASMIVNNSASAANTNALFGLTTGTSNSSLQFELADGSGSPSGLINLGSMVSGLTIQQSINGSTILKINNSNNGASAAVQYNWGTITANSNAIAGLYDNSGSPYWQFSLGSGVSGGAIWSPNTTFQGTCTFTTQTLGDSSTKAATTAFTANAMLGTSAQTWTNMTSSRSFGTTYTNSTSRPIQIIVNAAVAANSEDHLSISINSGSSFIFGSMSNSGGGNPGMTGTIIIPVSATYNVTGTNTIALNSWYELR